VEAITELLRLPGRILPDHMLVSQAT